MVQKHQEEEPASLWAFLSPMLWDSSSPTPSRRRSMPTWSNSAACHYLNQERLAEGASCGCITGRMGRALSSAYCVFRGISWRRWCRYWQGGVSERVSDGLARGLGCCKIQRETSRLILSCRHQATAGRKSEKGTSLEPSRKKARALKRRMSNPRARRCC